MVYKGVDRTEQETQHLKQPIKPETFQRAVSPVIPVSAGGPSPTLSKISPSNF
jgi:hypothetical protein